MAKLVVICPYRRHMRCRSRQGTVCVCERGSATSTYVHDAYECKVIIVSSDLASCVGRLGGKVHGLV